MVPEGSSSSGPGHWSPLGTLVTQTLRVGRCWLSTQQRPELGTNASPPGECVWGWGQALPGSWTPQSSSHSHLSPGGGGQAFWEGSLFLGHHFWGGLMKAGLRSPKPTSRKPGLAPVLPAPWLRLAHGVGRVGEGQPWEEVEIWDLGLVGHAIAPGVHKGAAQAGTSPGIFPLTSGWGLPCLQRCKRIPFPAVPGAAPSQRVLATPGAWATESEGDVPAWQEGRLGVWAESRGYTPGCASQTLAVSHVAEGAAVGAEWTGNENGCLKQECSVARPAWLRG